MKFLQKMNSAEIFKLHPNNTQLHLSFHYRKIYLYLYQDIFFFNQHFIILLN